MIIKTLENIPESTLKYFYLEFYFSNPQTKNNYKLPLILQVQDKHEAIVTQGKLLDSLVKEGMKIKKMNSITTIYSERLESIKKQIVNSQNINGFETIRLCFEKIENINSKKMFSKQVKVNTIKNQKTAMPKNGGDLFTLEINM